MGDRHHYYLCQIPGCNTEHRLHDYKRHLLN